MISLPFFSAYLLNICRFLVNIFDNTRVNYWMGNYSIYKAETKHGQIERKVK